MFVFFIKMHSLGNDFIVLDHREARAKRDLNKSQIIAISNRRTGVGCDQVVILKPDSMCHFYMEVFNQDGSKAQTCCNALRCVSLLSPQQEVTIATTNRFNRVYKNSDGSIAVNTGCAKFDWQDIPLKSAPNQEMIYFDHPLYKQAIAVNVGNPHLVFFLDDIGSLDVNTLGSRFSSDPLLPEGANISFAKIINKDYIALRVWERGVGETNACGTAASATFAAASKLGLINNNQVTISFKNGNLQLQHNLEDEIINSGPAKLVCRGIWQND